MRSCISNSHPISPPLSHGMCLHDHCNLLLPCLYEFLHENCNGKVQAFFISCLRHLEIWNKLPCHLSSISALPAFRKRLEHHLFSSAFPGISSPSTDITLCDVTTSTNVNHIIRAGLRHHHHHHHHIRLTSVTPKHTRYFRHPR